MTDVELQIEGVPDRAIADAIRKTVRRLRAQLCGSGDVRITITPSETRGMWNLGILAPPAGWHLDSFMAPVERLPELIEQTLKDRLARLSPTLG